MKTAAAVMAAVVVTDATAATGAAVAYDIANVAATNTGISATGGNITGPSVTHVADTATPATFTDTIAANAYICYYRY